MSAHLLFAPASAGKTHFAIDRIRALRQQQPLAPIWVIVPAQLQARDFKRRLAQAGGALNVRVGTFYTFYGEILAQAGTPLPRITDPVQYRLLRQIIERRTDEGTLRHYAALRDKPGLVSVVRNLIEELKRARIEPEAFAQCEYIVQRPRLNELAVIYADYQRWLQEHGWADVEGEGWLAARVLEQEATLCCTVALLVVDGFDEFNPTQLAVLRSLSTRAAETLITLTGALDQSRVAHRRFIRARHALEQWIKAQPEVWSPADRPARPQVLQHLEAALFEPNQLQKAADVVELSEASDRSEEARVALRWLKARIVRDGYRPAEVAVIARNLAEYRAVLAETAMEYGLPLRIEGGEPVTRNPAVATLLSVLTLPVDQWPYRGVIEAWRSPYFDWAPIHLEVGDADRLAVAARAHNIVRGADQWLDTLRRLSQVINEDNDEEITRRVPQGEEADRLAHIFAAFVERLTPAETATWREYTAFIEDLIGDDPTIERGDDANPEGDQSLNLLRCALNNPETARRDRAAIRAVKEVLRGLVLAEETLGAAQPIAYAHFLEEFASALDAATYEIEPTTHDAILAASVIQARGLAFRAVAVLGLAEGDFPQSEREDTLLRETDRKALRTAGLPLESRLRGDEVSLFYQALTRAQERLLITRPYLADDGQVWEASPYWRHIRELIDSEPQHLKPEDPLPLSEVASETELMAWLAQTRIDVPTWPWSEELKAHWQSVKASAHVLQARLAEVAQGHFEGDATSQATRLTQRYSAQHVWSASRLEAYGTCPLYFYFSSALELQPLETPEEGLDVARRGSILHEILEKVYQAVPDPADGAQVLSALPAVAKAILDEAPHRYGFRPTPLWDIERAEIVETVTSTLEALAELADDFVPRYFEQAYGIDQQPPLILKTSAGQVRLHGYIDRLDENPAGELRLIDYKSSGTPITWHDLEEGRRLQLPLYAAAARQLFQRRTVSSGFYWHLGSAKPSSLKLETCEGGVAAAIKVASEHIGNSVTAIRGGQFAPRPPAGGCPSYCPTASVCWRYVSRKF
jgi:ATP-dependent helicase/DNAse subunit B